MTDNSNSNTINAYKDVRRMTISAAFLGAVLATTAIDAEISMAKADKMTDESQSSHAPYYSETPDKQSETKQNHANASDNKAKAFMGAALVIGGLVATRKTSQKIRQLENNDHANKPPPSL